ncbi:MAG TPA: hypothetical protein VGG25_20615 [Streptosporangiaceae bacterium]
MDRIVIVGCGGSGKSHLARQLGAILGVTPVHLDTLHYDEDWNPLPAEEFAALQRELVAAPRWIIDGNYASSLPIRLTAASTARSASTTGSPRTSSATSSATARTWPRASGT